MIEINKTVEFYTGLQRDVVTYRTKRSIFQVVLRPGEMSSVITAHGMQKELVNAVKQFLNEYLTIKDLCDQVGNENELKAMYRAGFRIVLSKENKEKVNTLKQSLTLLNEKGSVYMELQR